MIELVIGTALSFICIVVGANLGVTLRVSERLAKLEQRMDNFEFPEGYTR